MVEPAAIERINMFKVKLKERTKDFFNTLKAEEICGFGFFTDEDAGSVNISYETKDHLAQMVADSPDERIYYKWYTNEWVGDDTLEDLNKELYKKVLENGNSPDFENQKQNTFNMFIEVLQELKQESLFDNTCQDFVLIFNVMDIDDEEQEVQWIEALNGVEEAKEFRDWLLD